MDRSQLGGPQKRAYSNIQNAMLTLLEAAMDQLTGIEGLRELRPQVGEQLVASGYVSMGEPAKDVDGPRRSPMNPTEEWELLMKTNRDSSSSSPDRVAARHRMAELFPLPLAQFDIMGELMRQCEECPDRRVGDVLFDIVEKYEGFTPSVNREAVLAAGAAAKRTASAVKKTRGKKGGSKK